MKKTSKGRELFKGITRDEAVRFVTSHKSKNNKKGKRTIHVTFPVDEIQKFIIDRGLKPTDFLRFYLGRNDEKRSTVIIVGAIPNGKESTTELTKSVTSSDIIGRDFGTLCPPQCDFEDTGSLASEVFWTKKKKPQQTKRKKNTGNSQKKR